MTQIERRPNQYAFLGTILVWLFLIILFSLTNLFPHKQNYKTVKIQLETPATPKVAEKQDAAAPKADTIAPAPSSLAKPDPQPPAPAKKEAAQKQPAKTQPKAGEKPAPKATQKPASKPAAQPAAKPAPKPAQQTLQKSVDELMAEQQSKKTAKKKEVNWDDMFGDSEEVESSSTPAPVTASSKNVNALEGNAGTTSSGVSGATASSSSSRSSSTNVSDTTTAALGSISATVYNSPSGNGVSSTSTIKTASAPEGRITMYMNDGSGRILLEPKKPVIALSERAAATIDATKVLKISFTVRANGHVDLNSVVISPSIIQPVVRDEIANQISQWRFSADSSSATATFTHKIEKR